MFEKIKSILRSISRALLTEEIMERKQYRQHTMELEKTLRILSIDAEKRNRQICDYAVNNMDVGAATRELADVLKNMQL